MLKLVDIPDKNDGRGESFYIPREAIEFIGSVDEIHFAAIEPGAVRGNHYHVGRRESIFVRYRDQWKLAWRARGNRETLERAFKGEGGILIMVEPEVVHAIKNLGTQSMHLVSCSNRRCDPCNPDTFPETLIQ